MEREASGDIVTPFLSLFWLGIRWRVVHIVNRGIMDQTALPLDEGVLSGCCH